LISSSGDVTVQGGSINDLSSDSFLALPSHVLDTSYYVMTYVYISELSRHAQGPTELGIVGVYDNTIVTIKLPRGIKQHSSELLRFTIHRLSTYQVCMV
jgi:hypothetical protein